VAEQSDIQQAVEQSSVDSADEKLTNGSGVVTVGANGHGQTQPAKVVR